MPHLNSLEITDYLLPDQTKQTLYLSYELFGQPLHQAPVVLVNHALTGNSTVTGTNGWWSKIIGEKQIIDLNKYTVLAFNIPGNGYDEDKTNLYSNYKAFTTEVIAALFWSGIDRLGIRTLYAVIGGSLGGSVAWEMALQRPTSINQLIPIATNLQASDWLIGQVHVQETILNNSNQPLEDARKHAMLLYRTPESIAQKFNRQYEAGYYAIESWLTHHGETLKKRYPLLAYRMMNHLLKTIGQRLTADQLFVFSQETTTNITLIAIDSDYMFTQKEQMQTYEKLTQLGVTVRYKEIQSIHGHDAFLIEYEQLNRLLQPLF